MCLNRTLLIWRGEGDSNPCLGGLGPNPALETGVLPLHYLP